MPSNYENHNKLHVYPGTITEYHSTLIKNYRCPIDWEQEGVGLAKEIFIQKWYYTVSDAMPNGEFDTDIMKDVYSYLSEPNDNLVQSISTKKIRSLCINSEDYKKIFRKKYEMECLKFTGLKAQSEMDRTKHYPIGCRNISEIVKLSKSNNKIGYIFPNFDHLSQLKFFWVAIDDAFERLTMQFEEDGLLERYALEKAWDTLLRSEHLVFCIDTMATVGYYAGKEARWLVYDTSFHGKVTHCYPALAPLPGSTEAAVNNLQGLKEAFINGEKFQL